MRTNYLGKTRIWMSLKNCPNWNRIQQTINHVSINGSRNRLKNHSIKISLGFKTLKLKQFICVNSALVNYMFILLYINIIVNQKGAARKNVKCGSTVQSQGSNFKVLNQPQNLLLRECIATTAHGCGILNHQSMPIFYSSSPQETFEHQMEVTHSLADSTSRIDSLNLVVHSSYNSDDLQSRSKWHLCRLVRMNWESNPQWKDHTFHH